MDCGGSGTAIVAGKRRRKNEVGYQASLCLPHLYAQEPLWAGFSALYPSHYPDPWPRCAGGVVTRVKGRMEPGTHLMPVSLYEG